MEKQKKIALIYDFDGTLSGKYMQEYKLFPEMMIKSFQDFLEETNKFLDKMDNVLAFQYFMVKCAKEKNIKITKEFLNEAGMYTEYFSGVETWFDRINKYGEDKGIVVEHYIISSGIKELLETCSIAKYFRKIYACEFFYDENGEAVWPACAINSTNKTQFLFKINKGKLDTYDYIGPHEYMPHCEREIPFENIIYIGDGMTDVPCMKIVKNKGGLAISVYGDEKTYEISKQLFEQGRVNFCAQANYTEGSELENSIKNFINEK